MARETDSTLHASVGRADRGLWVIRAVLLCVALSLAGFVHMMRADLPVARQLEANIRDLAMQLAASDTADPRLVIIDIDEESLKRVGPWPWPREALADLAETLLSDAGVSIVAFDLVLPDASAAEGGGDERLAALASQGWLVLAQAFDYVAREQPVRVGSVGGNYGLDAEIPAVPATGFVANFSPLSAGRCVGNIGFVPDTDGKVRRLAPWTRWADQRYPAYSLAVLACAKPALDITQWSRQIQVDSAGLWAVPYSRRPESYLAIPAEVILSRSFERFAPAAGATTRPEPALAGRIAIVGSSALGLADRVATPLSSSVSGVTVHAAALSALLDAAEGSAPKQPPSWAMPTWLVLSVGLLWVIVAGGRRLRFALVVAPLTLIVWAAIAGWITTSGFPQAVSGPLWGYASLLLLHLPIEWSWAHARVRSRTRLLSRYVAKEVLDELLAAADQDPLAPRHAEITVLIADMQDYTRLTSRSSLQGAAELTRGFLEQLTGPVLRHLGTLDRYTGDGLVAFWGAPIPTIDHADRAVDAAIEIAANVARFNDARTARGEPIAAVRVGIASGSALVGDLGTRFRIAYTAVGDCINLASRLQQQSRALGVNVVVSLSARDGCRRWLFESLGTVSIRGLPDQEVFKPAASLPSEDSQPTSREPSGCE